MKWLQEPLVENCCEPRSCSDERAEEVCRSLEHQEVNRENPPSPGTFTRWEDCCVKKQFRCTGDCATYNMFDKAGADTMVFDKPTTALDCCETPNCNEHALTKCSDPEFCKEGEHCVPNRSWANVVRGRGRGFDSLFLNEFRSTCCTATRQCKDRTRGDEICGRIGFSFKSDSTETYDVTDNTWDVDSFIDTCCEFTACPKEEGLVEAFDAFCRASNGDVPYFAYDVSKKDTPCTFNLSKRE